jgi:hypothetical protein
MFDAHDSLIYRNRRPQQLLISCATRTSPSLQMGHRLCAQQPA